MHWSIYSEVLRGPDSGTRELITATAEQLPSCGRLDTPPSGKTSYSSHILLRGFLLEFKNIRTSSAVVDLRVVTIFLEIEWEIMSLSHLSVQKYMVSSGRDINSVFFKT